MTMILYAIKFIGFFKTKADADAYSRVESTPVPQNTPNPNTSKDGNNNIVVVVVIVVLAVIALLAIVIIVAKNKRKK